MRPARKGPENLLLPAEVVTLEYASMRPARKGPENPVHQAGVPPAAAGLQ